MPLVKPNVWKQESELILKVDAADPSNVYYARAIAGSWTTAGKASKIWQIWKVTPDAQKVFAGGDDRFYHVYNDRAGYVYS